MNINKEPKIRIHNAEAQNKLDNIAARLDVEGALVDGAFVYSLEDFLNAIVDRLEAAESHSHSSEHND